MRVKIHPHSDDLFRLVRPVRKTYDIVNFRIEPKRLGKTNIEYLNALNNDVVLKFIYPELQYHQHHIFIRSYLFEYLFVSHRMTIEDFHIFIDSLFQMYRIRIQTYSQQNN